MHNEIKAVVLWLLDHEYVQLNTACFIWYLFIQELPGVLLYVFLVQVCGETHETHFRQTEISKFNVAHWRDQQTDGERQRQMEMMWDSLYSNIHSSWVALLTCV